MIEKKTEYVRVRDHSGREFICPVDALRKPEDFCEEELAQCWDSVSEAFSAHEEYLIIKEDIRKEKK